MSDWEWRLVIKSGNSWNGVRLGVATGHQKRESLERCPIVSGYRTSKAGIARVVSDWEWLPDIKSENRWSGVRVGVASGHQKREALEWWQIGSGYRTSKAGIAGMVSDWEWLSDIKSENR